jgi:hypothetical protein
MDYIMYRGFLNDKTPGYLWFEPLVQPTVPCMTLVVLVCACTRMEFGHCEVRACVPDIIYQECRSSCIYRVYYYCWRLESARFVATREREREVYGLCCLYVGVGNVVF